MQSDAITMGALARRSYEVGRALTSARRAAMVVALVAVVSAAALGSVAWACLPVTFVAVALSEWRGRTWMTASRRGVLAGFVTMALPLSILRPCCAPGAAMSASCCTTPSACWAAGAVVGLALSMFVPPRSPGPARRADGPRVEAALGMVVGVTSVAVVRCASLFAGEALGLLGGLAVAVVAGAAARAMVTRFKRA